MTDFEKLQEIIDEIDVLIEHQVKSFDSEFRQWHTKTKRFLHKKYGSDSMEYTEFTDLKFEESLIGFPEMWIGPVKKCCEDLLAAKELLSGCLNEEQMNPSSMIKSEESMDCMTKIFTRFHKVAMQLSRRHEHRQTLQIQDEYDVQDLLHALLVLYFDDVRPEEWTPSYAGGSARMDFLIPDIKSVIEVKMTRSSMTEKRLREELIIDIDYYQEHAKCKKIYFFVYDPNNYLTNPTAIKNDLERKHQGLVRVFIEP